MFKKKNQQSAVAAGREDKTGAATLREVTTSAEETPVMEQFSNPEKNTETDDYSPEESATSENAESAEQSDASEDIEETENAGDEEASAKYEATEERIEAAYCLGAGIDTETLAKAKALLNKVAATVGSGKFDPEMLQLAIRILNYDEEIRKIREEAYTQGREEKIAEAFRSRRAKAEEAAALPRFNGTKGMGSPLGKSIFDEARKAK